MELVRRRSTYPSPVGNQRKLPLVTLALPVHRLHSKIIQSEEFNCIHLLVHQQLEFTTMRAEKGKLIDERSTSSSHGHRLWE